MISKSNTCIAAIKNKRGKILIAADRRNSWDFSQYQRMPRPKVQKRNGLILAGTGDGFLCHLLVDMLDFPSKEEDTTPDNFLHGIFFDKVRKLLDRNGMVDHDKQLKLPGDTSVEIVIACSGKLYTMNIFNPIPESEHSNGLIAIDEVGIPYAVGCGGLLAWGALKENADSKFDSKTRLIRALTVAASVSSGCDNNIDICVED